MDEVGEEEGKRRGRLEMRRRLERRRLERRRVERRRRGGWKENRRRIRKRRGKGRR